MTERQFWGVLFIGLVNGFLIGVIVGCLYTWTLYN